MIKRRKHPNKCPICRRSIHRKSKYCIFHASAEEKTKKDFKNALKEYVNKIKKEDRNYNFCEFIFVGDINFKKDLKVNVLKNAIFNGATFEGDTDFKGVTFKGYAFFREVTFEGVTYFWRAIFKGYTCFREAIFKGDVFFGEAIFKGDAFFKGATFERYAFFQGATFEEPVDFQWATFEEDVGFGEVSFKIDTDFWKIMFEKYFDFREVTFEEDVEFGRATLKRGTGFWKGKFESVVDFGEKFLKVADGFKGETLKGGIGFWKTMFESVVDFGEKFFKGVTGFKGTTFEKNAYFKGITFEKNAYFKGTTFKKNAYLLNATFEGDADFRLKYLINVLYFSKIKTSPGKKLFIKIDNEGEKISLKRAHLDNTYLDIELAEGILIDFTDVLLKNTKIKKTQIENHILQEKEKEFSKAEEIYLLLKNNFHSIGRYDDESWAFKKEKDMERKSLSFPCYNKTLKEENRKEEDKKEKFPFLKWIKKGKFLKWMVSGFSNMIYGYGEKPWNVVKTAVAIILIFALSFSFIGLGNPEIIELKGTAIHQNSGNAVDLESKGLLKNNVIRNFPDSLYFSTITFTTLGYGDFRPLEGLGRILAGSEAFLGAIMMALFVYTFARRTGGR